jgi:hypothetical protein
MNAGGVRPGRGRGQAMVELAIMLVMLVPLMLWFFFVQDLLTHYLNWQETIVGPPWDGLTFDYEDQQLEYKDQSPPAYSPSLGSVNSPKRYFSASSDPNFRGTLAAKVQSVHRANYCDRSAAHSGYGSADPMNSVAFVADSSTSPECAGASSRWFGAAASWVVGDARPVTCHLESAVGTMPAPDFIGEIETGERKGGLLWCDSRLAVVNMILPKGRVFGWTTELEISEKNKFNGNDPDYAPPSSAWVLGGGTTPERFGVLHDTWALGFLKNIDPRYGSKQYSDQMHGAGVAGDEAVANHPFYRRVKQFYSGSPLAVEPDQNPYGIWSAWHFYREELGEERWPFLITPFGIFDDAAFISPTAASDGAYGNGNDPRTPTLAYRRNGDYGVGYAPPQASAYRYQEQNFAQNQDWLGTPVNTQNGNSYSGNFAAGWGDQKQKDSWAARDASGAYWGRSYAQWSLGDP